MALSRSVEKVPTYGTQEPPFGSTTTPKNPADSNSNDDLGLLNPPSWKFWKKRRYVVATMAFFGFFNTYALRVNLSIAIVAMTENVTVIENGTSIHRREFDWSSQTIGYILSSFFYGYITTQLLGGWISSKIGGKRVFGFGLGVTAVFALITPFLAHNTPLLITVRIVQGIFEGVTYPCIHAIWARWAPPLERSRLATIAFSGSYVGTVIAMPVSAFLAQNFGWPSIFYFFGLVALVWVALWWVVVAESPAEDRWIAKNELEYIKRSLENEGCTNVQIPWWSILTSMPVWAIVWAHFAENWGFYTLLTQLPKFMKDILDFDLGKTGYMSAVPYLAMSIVIQFAGQLADMLQERGYMTTVQVRKLCTCGAFFAQTIFMLGAAFWLTPIGTTVCLTLAVGLGGFAWSGFSVNYLDVSPHHASILMGLGNTVGTLPGIVSPILSGYVVSTPTAQEWQIVFYVASGVYLFGGLFYGVFAAGEVQSWAKAENSINNGAELKEQKASQQYENRAFTCD